MINSLNLLNTSIIENILTNSISFDLHIHFHITQQAIGVTHFVEEEYENGAVLAICPRSHSQTQGRNFDSLSRVFV